MDILNSQNRKSAPRRVGGLDLRRKSGRVPAGNYTISQICVIVGRQRSTVHREIRCRKLGQVLPGAIRRSAPGPAVKAGISCDYRVLNAKEVEQLRQVFQERGRRLNRRRK